MRILALALSALASACASVPVLDETRLVDLTHPLEAAAVAWPGEPAFRYEYSSFGRDPDGLWNTAGSFSCGDRVGTYVSAPLRLAEARRALDDVPIQSYVGPIRLLDVAAKCRENRDYAAGPDDLRVHEQEHGRVPAGAVVIVRTGWDRFWANPRRYLGTGEGPAETELHFPGLSRELARELIDRRVDLVAIDTAAIDPGASPGAPAQRALAEANVPTAANLTGLAGLPPIGASAIALPVRIAGATGGPVRFVALVP
jgi:kynurenine formamidase